MMELKSNLMNRVIDSSAQEHHVCMVCEDHLFDEEYNAGGDEAEAGNGLNVKRDM